MKWRKSSRSGQNGACVEIAHVADSVVFRTSSHSGGTGNCVELADAKDFIAVRDSKAPDAGHLAFSPRVWAVFMAEARAGRYEG